MLVAARAADLHRVLIMAPCVRTGWWTWQMLITKVCQAAVRQGSRSADRWNRGPRVIWVRQPVDIRRVSWDAA